MSACQTDANIPMDWCDQTNNKTAMYVRQSGEKKLFMFAIASKSISSAPSDVRILL